MRPAININKSLIRDVIIAILSFLASISMTMCYSIQTDTINIDKTILAMDNLVSSISGNQLLSTVVFLFIFLIARRLVIKIPRGVLLPYAVISFFCATICLMAESYRIDNTLSLLYHPHGQVIKSCIYVAGISFVILLFFVLLFDVILSDYFNSKISVTSHIFTKVFIFLMIFWAFPLILSYPANMNWDAWYQMQQFWRFSPFNTHQPIIHTLLMGTCTLVGYLFGNSSAGLFLFVFLQTIVYGLVISYSFLLLEKISTPNWLKALYLFLCCFSPYYVNSSNSVIKDSSYSISFLLLMIEIIYALIDIEEFVKKKSHWMLSMISIFGVISLRSNGIYIFIPIAVAIMYGVIKKCRKKTPIVIAKVAAILFIPVGGLFIFNFGFESAVSEVQKVSVSESLSLPFQQTARTVLYYADSITEDEYNAIDSVLEYDLLADHYDPRISDPVKALFKEECTTGELINYLETWIRMGIKHPITYFETVINQNYGLFYIKKENSSVFLEYLAEGELSAKFENSIGLFGYNGFEKQKHYLEKWYMLMFFLPIIGILSHPAFYTYVILGLTVIAIKNRKQQLLFLLLPLILTFVFIIIGPVFQWHPRYAFPIIYCIPLVVAYFIYEMRTVRIEK